MTGRSSDDDRRIIVTITSQPPETEASRHVAPTDQALSDRAIAVAGMFGLSGHDLAQPRPPITPTSSSELHCRTGSIVFVTGPSGAGKSCVLASIQRQLTERYPGVAWRLCDMRLDVSEEPPASSDQARVIDVISGDLEHATSALARAGLADAFLMVRHVRALSAGERARLSLARLISQVEDDVRGGMCVLLIDEFASLLDRETARGMASRVRRWIETGPPSRFCVIVATAHDDILESLRPDVLVFVDGSGAIHVSRDEDHQAVDKAVA